MAPANQPEPTSFLSLSTELRQQILTLSCPLPPEDKKAVSWKAIGRESTAIIDSWNKCLKLVDVSLIRDIGCASEQAEMGVK
jgi:hypothetical protein